MTIGAHDFAISKAQNALSNAKEAKTDVDLALFFKGTTLDKAQEQYALAKGAREYSDEMNMPTMYWPQNEYGLTKAYHTYPDGKTDLITDYDESGYAFSTRTISYDSHYDYTPNSIKHEYYNPATEYVYDKNGNCIYIADSHHDKVESTERYGYNEQNQLTYREVDSDHDGKVDDRQYFEYCEYGDLKSVTREDEIGIWYEQYNDQGLIELEKSDFDKDGKFDTSAEYTYDCSGRMQTMHYKGMATNDYYEYFYDQQGELSHVKYDNKYTNTPWGFFMGLLGDYDSSVLQKYL